MATLLEARHVTKVFSAGFFNKSSQTVAVDDFSLVIADEPPTITAVVGESGSGKTTLARLLLGVSAPTSGSVLYRGRDLRTLSRGDRRRFLRDIQVIFQDPYEVYNPFYKVDHVLEAPIQEFKLASRPDEARDLMEKTLRAVGLRPEETLGRYPHQHSGGQRQRIMVARALLLHPRLIIADEPVSMVDASLRATILDNLRELNRQFGISIIYITHDLTTAYQISENIVVLYRGSVTEAGDVEKVVRDPLHPYTRLLIGSVPLPDPDRVWSRRMRVPDEDQPSFPIHGGCKFADRCPNVMEKCGRSAPPMFQTDPHRLAACFLYESSPKIETDLLGDVFAARISSA